MSNSSWFYSDAQQQQHGPVTFAQIQQLAATGQIENHTLIWNQGMPSWIPAQEVQGVFSPAESPAESPASTSASPLESNPYAPPAQGGPPAEIVDSAYPIPKVKRCSFALYISLFVIGFMLYGLGMSWMSPESRNLSSPGVTPIETVEDLEQYERDLAERASEAQTETYSAKVLGALGLGLLFIMSGSILGLIYLYRAWFILQHGRPRTSPGKAVGFLFIPLFNLYWMFVAYSAWSPDWNRIRRSHQNLAHLPSSSNGLFLAGPILMIASAVPILGFLAAPAYLIIFLMMTHKMCQVVNAMADAQNNSSV